MQFITLTFVDGSKDVINFQHVSMFTKFCEHTRLYFSCPIDEDGLMCYDVQETPAAIMLELHNYQAFQHQLKLQAEKEFLEEQQAKQNQLTTKTKHYAIYTLNAVKRQIRHAFQLCAYCTGALRHPKTSNRAGV